MVETWVNLSPTSGSGNGTVAVSAKEPNTGRNNRTSTITFKSDVAGVTETREVIQRGSSEYVRFSKENYSAASSDMGIALEGESNSSRLTFESVKGINFPMNIMYEAAGIKNIQNGLPITGDPGAIEKYNFKISIPFPSKNTDAEDKTYTVKVIDNAGNIHTTDIKHSAADAFFTVDPESIYPSGSITLESNGLAKPIAISSNTSWRVF